MHHAKGLAPTAVVSEEWEGPVDHKEQPPDVLFLCLFFAKKSRMGEQHCVRCKGGAQLVCGSGWLYKCVYVCVHLAKPVVGTEMQWEGSSLTCLPCIVASMSRSVTCYCHPFRLTI